MKKWVGGFVSAIGLPVVGGCETTPKSTFEAMTTSPDTIEVAASYVTIVEELDLDGDYKLRATHKFREIGDPTFTIGHFDILFGRYNGMSGEAVARIDSDWENESGEYPFHLSSGFAYLFGSTGTRPGGKSGNGSAVGEGTEFILKAVEGSSSNEWIVYLLNGAFVHVRCTPEDGNPQYKKLENKDGKTTEIEFVIVDNDGIGSPQVVSDDVDDPHRQFVEEIIRYANHVYHKDRYTTLP